MQKRLNWHDPIAATIRESARTGERVVVAEFDGVAHELVDAVNGRTPTGFHVDTTWRPVDGDQELSRSAEVAEHLATQEAAQDDDNTDEAPNDATGLGQGWPENVAGDQRPFEV